MMSGHGNIETAMKAAKNGAFDFIEKPFKAERLILLVEKALEDKNLKLKILDFESKENERMELIGNSSIFKNIKQNLDKINWAALSMNPACIDILEQNKDKIDWVNISLNPEIFTFDYDAIKKRIEPLVEELMMKCYHPIRLERLLLTYNYDIGSDEYIEN